MCENVEKYKNTRLIDNDDKLSKLIRKPYFMTQATLVNEAGEFGAYEVISKRKRTNDSKAHHVGVAILQWSKLLFIRLVII